MIEIGLVGCPNSGKSTFFKAATLKDVKIAPYPFTTLEPNEGLAHVTVKCPCTELKLQCKKCVDGVRFVPMKLWDVAGLVPDAHLGRGRGNAFLDDIMQTKAFIHVLDASGKTDSEGNAADGFDPSQNVRMLERELDYWLLNIMEKDWKILSDKNFFEILAKRFSGLGIDENDIKKALSESSLDENTRNWRESDELRFINNLRLISKPMLIAANKVDVLSSEKNIEKMKSEFQEYNIIPTSTEIELALREAAKENLIKYIPGANAFEITGELSDKQKNALDFIKKFIERRNTGVQETLNRTVFDLLGMIVVYPVADQHKFTDKYNNVLPDALLLKRGATALDLAYEVHQDIGKKFIAAVDARTGKNVSADYKLKDGDIISIKSGR
ncbi:MAG: redox-regulated ATPase YchF [Candidatus Aenigmatarchaeota archaeon]